MAFLFGTWLVVYSVGSSFQPGNASSNSFRRFRSPGSMLLASSSHRRHCSSTDRVSQIWRRSSSFVAASKRPIVSPYRFALAFFAAHRFFKAATIAALPALLSFRLGFAGSGVAGAGGSGSPRIFAHRRC